MTEQELRDRLDWEIDQCDELVAGQLDMEIRRYYYGHRDAFRVVKGWLEE